jgi:hypothetical protein
MQRVKVVLFQRAPFGFKRCYAVEDVDLQMNGGRRLHLDRRNLLTGCGGDAGDISRLGLHPIFSAPAVFGRSLAANGLFLA